MIFTNEKILLLSKGSTFMVDAIANNLKDIGYEVVRCEPSMKRISENIAGVGIILFYLGDYLEDIAEDLVFLKDICIEKELSFNVIGDEAEVNTLKKIISEARISNVFSRPLDIKKLITTMVSVSEGRSEENQKKNILLVDDDVTFLKMVKGWLSEDYKVTVVTSGMQAITYMAKNRPDLILLDYEMPVTSGPQILEMIRSEVETASIPVFFLTGKGDKESVTKVLAFKPEGYILKSAGRDELTEQIENYFIKQKY